MDIIPDHAIRYVLISTSALVWDAQAMIPATPSAILIAAMPLVLAMTRAYATIHVQQDAADSTGATAIPLD